MKICLLYTSYRQFPELDLALPLAERQPRLRRDGHVLFHCNNGQIPQAAIAEKVARLPYASTKLFYRPQQNTGGYPYGQFEAILDMWDDVMAGGFDLVLHLHPDIFIIDENTLLDTLMAPSLADKNLFVTKCFGHRHPSYATDFFAFRPDPRLKAVYQSYIPLLSTPLVVPLEALHFIEIFRSGVPHDVVPRFTHGHYHRDIDRLGLWHEHNLERVSAYLRKPSARWNTTIRRAGKSPRGTLRAIATYYARKAVGKPQDSLPKQLTTL